MLSPTCQLVQTKVNNNYLLNQMISRFKFLVLLLLFLSISNPAIAQESSGKGGGGDNRQTPVQVIVQIVVTAGILQLLNKFNLP